MATRTVNIALATFTNPDGNTQFGLKGQTVEVHDDHVAAFDAANGSAADADGGDAPKKRGRTRRAPAKDDAGESADS